MGIGKKSARVKKRQKDRPFDVLSQPMPLTDDEWRWLVPLFQGEQQMAAKKGSKCATDNLGMMPKGTPKAAKVPAPKAPVRPSGKARGR